MAARADIVGAFPLHRPQDREQRFGAVIVVASLPATGARHRCGVVAAPVQERRQQGRAGSMKSRASSHLDRFQVETMALVLGGKDYLEERLDFPRDFLMNPSSRFFPPPSSPSDRARPGAAGKSAH